LHEYTSFEPSHVKFTASINWHFAYNDNIPQILYISVNKLLYVYVDV